MRGDRRVRSFVRHLGGRTSQRTRFDWPSTLFEHVTRGSKSLQPAIGHAARIRIFDRKHHRPIIGFGHFD